MQFNILKIILSYLTIPLILYLGIRSSYTDIKKSKIYNNDLLRTLYIGIAIQIISIILFTFFSRDILPKNILLNIILNSLLSFLTGLLFWFLKLWAAGDVKLFFIYSTIMPINYFILNQNRFFPSFDALVNIFIFVIIFILFDLIISIKDNIKKVKFKKSIRLSKKLILNFFRIIFSMVFMILILNKARNLITNYIALVVKFDMLFVYVLIIMFFKSFMRFFMNKIIFIISIIGLFLYIIINILIQNYSFLKDLLNFISIGFIIAMISMIIIYYLEKTDFKEISLNDLNENMLVSKDCIKKLEKSETVNEGIKYELKGITSDGLMKNHIEIFKKYYPSDKIIIENTFAFAPFIFLGVLSSLFFQKSILEFILSYIKK